MYVATRSGLGDAQSAARNVQVIGSAAAGTATGVLTVLAAHGVLGLTTAAIPVIGPALAAAVMLVQFLVANSGCGQTCVVTSQWANQAADALQQVMDGYFALPAPRTRAQKAAAVAAFDAIWQQLKQTCSQPNLGDAGKRCISDREAGACVWRQKYAPVYPGQPEIGECWNWFNGYLKPIQDDPAVPDPVDDLTTSVSQGIDSLFAGGASPSFVPLLLAGGLLALAVAV